MCPSSKYASSHSYVSVPLDIFHFSGSVRPPSATSGSLPSENQRLLKQEHGKEIPDRSLANLVQQQQHHHHHLDEVDTQVLRAHTSITCIGK